MGNPLGRFPNLRQDASIMVSIDAMAVGDNAIKQWVCMILEFAPYKSKRCFMHGGRGVERIALVMLWRVSRVYTRYALGHSDAIRAVPRYPPGRVSSYEMIGNVVLTTRMLARRDCSVSSLCAYCLIS